MATYIKIDPTGHFTSRGVPHNQIYAACGEIPYWITNNSSDRNFLDTIKDNYRFGIYETSGGQIDEKGIFTFAGDPPLIPLISARKNKETLYQYEHAFVSIIKDGEDNAFITRLD